MPPISGKKRTKEIAIRVTEDELAALKKRQQGTTMAGQAKSLLYAPNVVVEIVFSLT